MNTTIRVIAMAVCFLQLTFLHAQIHWLHMENSPLGDFPDGPWVDASPYVHLVHAIQAIGTNEVTLLISEPIDIGVLHLVIPQNITLQFLRGGSLFFENDSVRVTIENEIQAGLYQIFDGRGHVSMRNTREVYPQWWGAVGDGITDDSRAINRAINALPYQGGVVTLPYGQKGRYAIDNTVLIRKTGVRIVGKGTGVIGSQPRLICNNTKITGGSDGIIKAASNTFTSNMAQFTPDDVGKAIEIKGAWRKNSFGQRAPLSTTIRSVKSSTQIVLSDKATFSVTGTDYQYGMLDSTMIKVCNGTYGAAVENLRFDANFQAAHCLHVEALHGFATLNPYLSRLRFENYNSYGLILGEDNNKQLKNGQLGVVTANHLTFGGGGTLAASGILLNAQNAEYINFHSLFFEVTDLVQYKGSTRSINQKHHIHQISGGMQIFGLVSTRARDYAIVSRSQVGIYGWRSEDRFLLKQHAVESNASVFVNVHQRNISPRKRLENLPNSIRNSLDVDGYIGKLKYDWATKHLIFNGKMTTSERDDLLSLSNDHDYQKAIKELYADTTLGLWNDPADIVFDLNHAHAPQTLQSVRIQGSIRIGSTGERHVNAQGVIFDLSGAKYVFGGPQAQKGIFHNSQLGSWELRGPSPSLNFVGHSHLFKMGRNFVPELDLEIISIKLKELFMKNDEAIPVQAKMSMLKKGSKWIIQNNNNSTIYYTISRVGQYLYVYATGKSRLESMGTITGLKGLSALGTPSHNLRGSVTIQDQQIFADVTFKPSKQELDASYFIVATVNSEGDVPAEARTIYISQKKKTGFRINVAQMPGSGKRVEVAWILIR